MSFSKATESLALECRVTHSLLGLAFCCLTLRLFSIVGCQGASHTLFPSTCQRVPKDLILVSGVLSSTVEAVPLHFWRGS